MKTKKPKTGIERVRESAKEVSEQLMEARKALTQIAIMGDGMKSEVIDWANIGKNAKYLAQTAIKPKCPRCGK